MTQSSSRSNCRIEGTVVDDKGKPISGAHVQCGEKRTLTLFDGTYKLEDLKASTQIVIITQKGFKTLQKTTDLGEKKTEILDFRLSPNTGYGRIYGQVYDSKTRKPLSEGTMIMVFPATNKQVHIKPANGSFEFPNLPSGTHEIWTSILGYLDDLKMVSLKENEEKQVDFYCRKNEAVEPPWG